MLQKRVHAVNFTDDYVTEIALLALTFVVVDSNEIDFISLNSRFNVMTSRSIIPHSPYFICSLPFISRDVDPSPSDARS